MAKRTYFFLAITLCAIAPTPSSATPEDAITAGVCLLAAMNWGSFTGVALVHFSSAHYTQSRRHILNVSLTRPFCIWRSEWKYTYFGRDTDIVNGTLYGTFVGGTLAIVIDMMCYPYSQNFVDWAESNTPHWCVGLVALCSAHAITYTLAQRALQWHIDRSYYRDLTRGA